MADYPKNFAPDTKCFTDPSQSRYDEMVWHTYEEQLRQAQWIFTLSCLAIIVAIIMTLSAGYLMFSGQATQASINAVMGLISTGLYVPLMRAANNKLRELRTLTKDFKTLTSLG